MTKAICEVAEAVSAYRDNRHASIHVFNAEQIQLKCCIDREAYTIAYQDIYDRNIKDTVQDELADAAIYCLLASTILKEQGVAQVQELAITDDSYARYITEDQYDFVTFAGHIIRKMADDPTTASIFDIIRCIETYLRFNYNQELETFILAKMEYNRNRPYRHGRKYDPTI